MTNRKIERAQRARGGRPTGRWSVNPYFLTLIVIMAVGVALVAYAKAIHG